MGAEMLTIFHKEHRITAAHDFLHHFNNKEYESFLHVVTNDVTLILYINAKTNQQSIH